MNKLQEKELSILRQFDQVCREHGLQYFLAYGTVLGAVRHHGFIPWDDDIDVMMLRGDFDKLAALPEEAWPKNLILQNVYVEKDHPYPFSKVRDRESTFVETGCEELDIVHGVFIDVFPLDYIPENFFGKVWQKLCAEYRWLLMAKNRPAGRVGKLAGKLLNLGLSDARYVERLRKAERQVAKYEGRSGVVVNLSFGARGIYAEQPMEIEMFTPLYVDFEGEKYPIVEKYDQFLTGAYGDYMQLPPVEKRISDAHPAVLVDLEHPYERSRG